MYDSVTAAPTERLIDADVVGSVLFATAQSSAAMTLLM